MPKEFLLAGNTATGFKSYFADMLNARRVICIKGGSGVGKSTFMRTVRDTAKSYGYDTITVPCSSDINSLDMVKVIDIDTVILDATAPHVFEPKYYGAVGEIVNLGDFLDKKFLKGSANEIKKLTDEKSLAYECMYNHIAGGKYSMDNIDKMYRMSIKRGLTESYAMEIITGSLPESIPSDYNIRAFGGYIDDKGYHSVVTKSIDERSVIRLASRNQKLAMDILNDIDKYLELIGMRREVYYSLIFPDTIESIGLGDCFLTSSPVIEDADEIYDIDAIIDNSVLGGFLPSIISERLSYNSSIARAGEYFGKARELHGSIEELYYHAMNFSALEKVKDKIIKDIFK